MSKNSENIVVCLRNRTKSKRRKDSFYYENIRKVRDSK